MSRVTRSQSRAASNASGDTNFPDIMELIQQSRDTARVATPVAETSRSVGFPSVRSREKRPARNRLSPPHRINSVPFNGQFTPSKKYVVSSLHDSLTRATLIVDTRRMGRRLASILAELALYPKWCRSSRRSTKKELLPMYSSNDASIYGLVSLIAL